MPAAMLEQHWNIIRPLIVEACSEFFAAETAPINLRAESVGLTLKPDGVAVFVGITSAQIRGSIGLALPFTMLERTHPLSRSAHAPRRELRDWACEMTNQLAGRIKTKLLPHGIAFRISPPMEVLGTDVRMPDAALEPVRRVLVFSADDVVLYVHFAALISLDVEVRPEPAVNPQDAAEGAVLVF